MMLLIWSWVIALLVVLGLYLRGYIRAKMRPVSYEWSWSPIAFVSNSLFPKGRALWGVAKEEFRLALHRLFHIFFHQLKKFHDRIFGKTVPLDQGAPSFFLKTIAENKIDLSDSEKTERKNGLS